MYFLTFACCSITKKPEKVTISSEEPLLLMGLHALCFISTTCLERLVSPLCNLHSRCSAVVLIFLENFFQCPLLELFRAKNTEFAGFFWSSVWWCLDLSKATFSPEGTAVF